MKRKNKLVNIMDLKKIMGIISYMIFIIVLILVIQNYLGPKISLGYIVGFEISILFIFGALYMVPFYKHDLKQIKKIIKKFPKCDYYEDFEKRVNSKKKMKETIITKHNYIDYLLETEHSLAEELFKLGEKHKAGIIGYFISAIFNIIKIGINDAAEAVKILDFVSSCIDVIGLALIAYLNVVIIADCYGYIQKAFSKDVRKKLKYMQIWYKRYMNNEI